MMTAPSSPAPFEGHPPQGLPLRGVGGVFQRFTKHVILPEDPEGCFILDTSEKAKGYPGFGIAGKCYRGNRVAWMLFHGAIPAGSHVLHRCDNRRCVRPDHLFLGTNKINCEDMTRKGRSRFGERNSNVRLSPDDVIAIRDTYSKGGITQAELGKRYGVSQSTAHCVITRKKWKHLDVGIKNV